MTLTRNTATLGLAFTVAVGFVIVACDSKPASSTSPTGPSAIALGAHDHQGAATTGAAGHVQLRLTPEIEQQLNDLRALTAPFHNFDKAVEYGYSVPAPAAGVCISDPVRGGMGFHYTRADKDLIGDGVVNLLEPEFLVYAPKENGGVKFSALDYFVPYPRGPRRSRRRCSACPSRARTASRRSSSTSGCIGTTPPGSSRTTTRASRYADHERMTG